MRRNASPCHLTTLHFWCLERHCAHGLPRFACFLLAAERPTRQHLALWVIFFHPTPHAQCAKAGMGQACADCFAVIKQTTHRGTLLFFNTPITDGTLTLFLAIYHYGRVATFLLARRKQVVLEIPYHARHFRHFIHRIVFRAKNQG